MEDLILKLKRQNITLNVIDNQLNLEVPETFQEEELLQEVREHKQELIEYIKNIQGASRFPELTVATEKEYYPLSSAQKRMYFLYEFDKKSTAYNLPQFVKLTGKLHQEKLETAFQKLIERHEILRTSFLIIDGETFQKVEDEFNFSLEVFTAKTEAAIENIIPQFIRPFDLSKAPLLRAGLIALSEEEHILMLDMHHIASDGYSQGLLIDDFMKIYGQQELKPVQWQYKDYAEWQQSEAVQNKIKSGKVFWLNQFKEDAVPLDLPMDYPRSAIRKDDGDTLHFEITKAETEALNNIAKEEGTTIFMVVLALYNIFLSKLSGETDISIGTSVAGREQAGLDAIVGMFVNTLVLRNFPTADLQFDTFLAALKENTVQCFEHQEYQFEQLIEELQVVRDNSRNALFDAHFTFQNFEETALSIPELVLTSYHRNTKVSKFDLELGAMEVEGTLKLYFEYAAALFKEETMQRFTEYFKKIVAAVVQNKSVSLQEIDILSQEEYNVLSAVNKTNFQPETAHTIVSLFEQQVEKTPNSIAVVYGEQQLTYAELNARSNQLARYLKANYDVGRDKIVSILMQKSADYLVSILGVLKSGSCYLPIDGDYPSSRKVYMVEDSGSVLLLSKGLNGEGLLYENVPVVDISLAELDRFSSDNLNLNIREEDLAYVIYTSGSTGVPKGVMIEHSGNVNMSSDQVRRYNVNENDVVVWFASVGFDASVFEIMMAMYSGATLAIPASGVIKNKDRFVEFLENTNASIVTFPPSYVALLSVEELKGLRLVITAGEAAQGSKAFEITASGKEYYNAYGPTECSVCVSVYKYDSENGILQNVPIGAPIANTRLYVLDADLKKVAPGVWGELCVSGVGLSRGYIGKEALTAEKFVSNPYEEGTKMYRTGDICRWNTKGELEFKGRKDTQVKLRGYRIELGEIEAVINLQEGISQSVVVIHGEGEAQDLGCYVVMEKNTSLDVEKLKTALIGVLPEYMVPTHYMALEELPLTINGKIDKKRLPALVVTTQDYQAPTTDTEHKLAALWSEVLEINEDTISTTKSFFELGGNSLTAISLVNKLQEKLEIKIGLDEFFTQPTIKGIIQLLPTATYQEYQKIEPVAPAKYYELSSAQKRMYFLYELDKNSIAYNAPYFVILNGKLDAKHLENSFKKLVERHESLRTSFEIVENAPLQYIIPTAELDFTIETYELISGKDEKALMQEFVRPFQLEKAPLFRVGLIRLESDKHVLMLDMHHIISDGYSQGILINDFAKIYQGETLEPLKIQYKDYAHWQQSEAHYDEMLQHREYWLNIFAEDPVELKLPYDFMRPASIGEEGNIFEFELSPEETQSLKKIADEHGATLFMVVLAVYNILLSKLSGETDITIGTSVSGREHNDLETIVGMFVNTLVLRNYPSFDKNIEAFLQELKQNTIQSFEHQGYQYEELIEDLKLTGDTSNNPLFDAHFTFQNFKDATFTIPGLELQTYEFEVAVTKFDIELSVMEFENKLQLTFEYATSLFTKETIQRFSNYFRKIVKHIIQDTSSQISEINILGDEEQKFFNKINTTEASYPLHKTVVDLFEAQAIKTPNNIAITFGEEKLTYQELNRRSNQLAHYLKKEQGIGVEDIVGILLPKSSDFIVSILATLKCGAAYLPLDAKLPAARIAQMTDVKQLKTTIASRELQEEKVLNKVLIFDDIHLENQEENNLQVAMNANTLAYIIYTSGSTGVPKGAMIEHKGIVNTALDHINIYDITEDDTLTWFAAVGFDVAIFEITMSLLSGATLAIPVAGAIQDQAKYVRFITDANITLPTIPPTYLDLMSLEDIKGIRGVITGGEAGNIDKANEIVAAGIRYFNSYGMTECAVCVSYFELKKEDKNLTRIPIGKPIANTRLYVLDADLKKVATGVWGELCVSGVGVSRGYIGKEALTAEKFIANPYEEGTKMYRTGDICRWNTKGELEFKGRKDTQVKLRGYRIELGEIESVVSLQEGISQSVVVLHGEGEVQDLACYVVLDKNTSLDTEALKASLTEALPEYMVPTHYMTLEELPLTINGKVDKKRLPAIETGSLEGDSDFTEIELSVRSIWSDILEIDEERIFKG
ncbi:amino acid adenylation domain-containing protein, partial [Kordia periserrulae]